MYIYIYEGVHSKTTDVYFDLGVEKSEFMGQKRIFTKFNNFQMSRNYNKLTKNEHLRLKTSHKT